MPKLKNSLLCLLVLLTSIAAPVHRATAGDASEKPSAQPGNDMSALTPEQSEVAQRMLDFMADTEKNFWKRVAKLDGDVVSEDEHVWDITDNGLYEVRVKRGPKIEKAGVMTVMTYVEQPPFIIGGRWNRFIEVAMHPQSPLVGMLHATFSVQVANDGSSNIGATMDMMADAQPPEDLELMRSRISKVFEKHAMPPDKFRPHGCGEPNEKFWKWHRPGTCTGVSLYGKQFLADEKTFDLVSELYTTTLDTYFEILQTRMAQPYGAEELAKQDFMRRRWLEDQLYWDVLAMKFVPYEAWSAVNAPPVVKF